jgi:hypothetical protein
VFSQPLNAAQDCMPVALRLRPYLICNDTLCRLSGLVLFAVLATVILGGFGARAEQAAAANAASAQCIETPVDYKTAFNNCAPVTCVSPHLFGTIIVQPPQGTQATIYPAGFHWAWTSGNENLQQYAAWHQPVCQHPSQGSAVSNEILLYVGFGQNYINQYVKGQVITLEVMDLSNDKSLFVPTPAAWFKAFQRDFGLNVPLDTQKAMTLGLGDRPGRNAVPLNPTRNFADITGCSPASAEMCSDTPHSACSLSYRNMADLLQNYSPYGSPPDNTTARCVGAYNQLLAGRQPDAAEARAMLVYCQDVNPCNTGLGYGYNPAVPTTAGPPATHFTGPEFVLLNRELSSIGAVGTNLPEIQ